MGTDSARWVQGLFGNSAMKSSNGCCEFFAFIYSSLESSSTAAIHFFSGVTTPKQNFGSRTLTWRVPQHVLTAPARCERDLSSTLSAGLNSELSAASCSAIFENMFCEIDCQLLQLRRRHVVDCGSLSPSSALSTSSIAPVISPENCGNHAQVAEYDSPIFSSVASGECSSSAQPSSGCFAMLFLFLWLDTEQLPGRAVITSLVSMRSVCERVVHTLIARTFNSSKESTMSTSLIHN